MAFGRHAATERPAHQTCGAIEMTSGNDWADTKPPTTKGDFSAERRLIWISAVAIFVGASCAVVAVLLLWLIGFFTNVFYYHEFSIVFRTPAAAATSAWAVGNPVIGGIIIGLMARYGSERIR